MSNSNETSLLVFGAHPDDIEFGCGGVIALETAAGHKAHHVVCSLGESATSGTPELRAQESCDAAAVLGSTIELIDLDGDAHLEIKTSHAIKLAEIIRRIRPTTVLAPTCMENQHPDHWRLGQLVRDAARLARYGGLKELLNQPSHSIDQLMFFAVTPDAEPRDVVPVLIDVSSPEIIAKWTASMNAYASQTASRNYVEVQLTRAKLLGARAGIEYAIPLFPNDPLVFSSLSQAGRGARNF